jgi:hypothetical protein
MVAVISSVVDPLGYALFWGSPGSGSVYGECGSGSGSKEIDQKSTNNPDSQPFKKVTFCTNPRRYDL